MCASGSPSRSAATLPTTARSRVLRLGNRWDLVFHQSLKRDAKGDVIEFDIDPRLMEQFAAEASAAIRKRMDEQRLFAIVTAAETRPLRADDHRAHVPDAAGAVAARNRARVRGQVAGDDLVTALIAGALAGPHDAWRPGRRSALSCCFAASAAA